MVTRNEADRYLEQALQSLKDRCDSVGVYDDQSDDDTLIVAAEYAVVQVRPDRIPSFAEHEGAFRQAAWSWYERYFELQPGDWVVSIDADEVLDGDIQTDIVFAADDDRDGLILPIDELWQADPPRRRVDGWWGKIIGMRARRWEPGRSVPQKAMASGSLPPARQPMRAEHARIHHYGYAQPADRRIKHARYRDQAGHSVGHVRSILDPNPTLEDIPL